MTMALIQEDHDIMQLVNQYVCVRKDQLYKLYSGKRVDKLIHNGLLREEGPYIISEVVSATKKNIHMTKAVDILVHYNDKITYHSPSEYPFLMFFMMNNKCYDVAYIEPGQEILMAPVINRTQAENVIVIIDDEEQVTKLGINKNVTYCMLTPEVKLYK